MNLRTIRRDRVKELTAQIADHSAPRWRIFVRVFCLLLLFLAFKINAQPYWDPNLATGTYFSCGLDYCGHAGATAAKDGTVFVFKNWPCGEMKNELWRWNPCDGWTDLGFLNSTNSEVNVCCYIKGNYLYVGGQFYAWNPRSGPPQYFNNIARMEINTGTWSQVGDASLGTITAIYVDDYNRVYAAESYTAAGSPAIFTNLFVMTNGATWSPIVGLFHKGHTKEDCSFDWDTNGPPNVNVIIGDNTNIYVGGAFGGAIVGNTEIASPCVIKWNGSTWEPISVSCDYGHGPTVYSLALLGTNLFVGGMFNEVSNPGGLSGSGNDPSQVYESGLYTYSTVTKQKLSFVSLGTYDGQYYAAGGLVGAILSRGTNLYVAGKFDYVYDPSSQRLTFCTNITQWDGQKWTPLGPGYNGSGPIDLATAPCYFAAATNSIFLSSYLTCPGGGFYSPEVGRWVTGPETTCPTNSPPCAYIPELNTPQITSSTFSFTATAVSSPDTTWGVYKSEDLKSWTSIGSLSLTSGSGSFSDNGIAGVPHRFYKLSNSNCCSQAIGFTRIVVSPGTITYPGTNALLANQLDAPPGDTLDGLFNINGAMADGTVLPKGTVVQKWDVPSQTFFLYTWNGSLGSGWRDGSGNPAGTVSLSPGEGAFLCNFGANPLNVTFVGLVREGPFSTVLPSGGSLRMISAMVPMAGRLQTDLGYAPHGRDSVQLWIGGNNSYAAYSYIFGQWSPQEPAINIGQAFFWRGTNNVWQMNFSDCQ